MHTVRILLIFVAMAAGGCREQRPEDPSELSAAQEDAMPPDTGDPLETAQRLARQGHFEDALRQHIWIHDHVLETNPAYYGVRLSFALAEWIELGREYPAALQALREIRDRKTARLSEGLEDRDLFHDVTALNRALEEPQATVALFQRIGEQRPAFATEIYELADEDVVKAGDYALARKYVGDPDARLATARERLEEGRQFASTSSRPELAVRTFENIYVEEVVRLIQIFDRTGDRTAALAIQAKALKGVDRREIRDAIGGR